MRLADTNACEKRKNTDLVKSQKWHQKALFLCKLSTNMFKKNNYCKIIWDYDLPTTKMQNLQFVISNYFMKTKKNKS